MISGILFINTKGDVLISRYYRNDISRSIADIFRIQVIASKEIDNPVRHLNDCSFMYIRQGDIYILAVTKNNANSTLAFQFLYQIVNVFKAYFKGKFDENTIKSNFVLIYELLDEMMDYGYPQIVSVDVLRDYVKIGKLTDEDITKSMQKPEADIGGKITGVVDWRQPDKHKYKKNSLWIDILENVNLLLSNKGTVLRGDVSGKVQLKTCLSGMPECKLGLNDRALMKNEDKKASRGKTGIAIDDVSFHRCVRLGKFETERSISFVPPDGEFTLMKYRITNNVKVPFSIVPVITEHGSSRVEFEIMVTAKFAPRWCNNLKLFVPTPHNTASWKHTATLGSVKYSPEKHCLIWKVPKFPGDAQHILKAEVRLLSSIRNKPWSRPPITMEFQIPMFTSSGLQVRFLRVFERANYDTVKWVRYITKSGTFQIRI